MGIRKAYAENQHKKRMEQAAQREAEDQAFIAAQNAKSGTDRKKGNGNPETAASWIMIPLFSMRVDMNIAAILLSIIS